MEYINKTAIKEATGLREKRLAELVSDGVFKKGGKGLYAASSVYDYFTAKLERSKPENHAEIKMEQDKLKNKLLEQQIDENEGRLVDYNDMYGRAGTAARTARDKMLNIIPRVVPILAHENEPDKIQAILNKEIRAALSSLAEYIKDDE